MIEYPFIRVITIAAISTQGQKVIDDTGIWWIVLKEQAGKWQIKSQACTAKNKKMWIDPENDPNFQVVRNIEVRR